MDVETLQAKYEALAPVLNERARRLWAASEARALGYGGIALVMRATGMARTTISRGLHELESETPLAPDRSRRPGGGRKAAIEKDVTLLADLDALLEPTTAGLPDAPLRWTSKSVRKLAAELQVMGHQASHRLVGDLLHQLGYSLQGNRKSREETEHPDRARSSTISTTRYASTSNAVGSTGALRTRSPHLPQGRHRERRTDGPDRSRTPCIPRRLELHDSA